MPNMIMKRDGRTKPYDKQRIDKAIASACMEYYGDITKALSPDILSCLDSIYHRIDILEEDPIDVEVIQDIVVEELFQVDAGLAECYSDYRTKRSIYRNSKSELIDAVSGLLDFTNEEVLTENANKQSQLVSTQRDLLAGVVSKYIS